MKRTPGDLAIFGGSTTFPSKLHVGRPHTGDREVFFESIRQILDRRWLTNHGPCVQELEARVADFVGVKHCVVVCNGTLALSILIRAAGLTGQVVVPSFTFVATAHALQWQGISPVFCDIDPDTHTLDPERLEECITPTTTGVIPVHTWGRTKYIDAIVDVGRRHGLFVGFDAAHAFGCAQRSQRVGGFGDAEVFSFHATKVFNTSEGGAITTNNDELAEKARLMRNFGFKGFDNVVHLGINAKMSELSAAFGLSLLPRIDEVIATNRENYGHYKRGLTGLPAFRLLRFDPTETPNYQYVVLEVDRDAAGLDRDQILALLHAENIIARRYFFPGCHRMEPYKARYSKAAKNFPVTDALVQKTLVLPTGDQVGKDSISEICGILSFLCEHSAEIRQRLASRKPKA
jgi:dTDP-4-amino-4,6-dideoxygalactose transaminase